MMNIFKTVLASTAALGLVLSSTANAEPVRAAGSFPGVVSANKVKVARKAAPAGQESKAILQAGFATFAAATAAAGLAGYAFFKVVENKDNTFDIVDSPG